MICEMCEKKEAKHVISNRFNRNKLKICVDCKEYFKNGPSQEVKT